MCSIPQHINPSVADMDRDHLVGDGHNPLKRKSAEAAARSSRASRRNNREEEDFIGEPVDDVYEEDQEFSRRAVSRSAQQSNEDDEDGDDSDGDTQPPLKKQRVARIPQEDMNPNARHKGRRLVNWKGQFFNSSLCWMCLFVSLLKLVLTEVFSPAPKDAQVLLCLHHTLHAHGIDADALWTETIRRVEGDKNKTGQALTQHFDKLRTRVFEAGGMVPPWNGRDNCPRLSNRYRGIIKVDKAIDPRGWREVGWDENLEENIDPTVHFNTSVSVPGLARSVKEPGKMAAERLSDDQKDYNQLINPGTLFTRRPASSSNLIPGLSVSQRKRGAIAAAAQVVQRGTSQVPVPGHEEEEVTTTTTRSDAQPGRQRPGRRATQSRRPVNEENEEVDVVDPPNVSRALPRLIVVLDLIPRERLQLRAMTLSKQAHKLEVSSQSGDQFSDFFDTKFPC